MLVALNVRQAAHPKAAPINGAMAIGNAVATAHAPTGAMTAAAILKAILSFGCFSLNVLNMTYFPMLRLN
jgi:hypothetical protein